MITNDTLWKGIIEDLLPDFLGFFYPNVAFQNDKFEFLDKELDEIHPLVEGHHKQRRVDKLIKAFTTTGQERWILIHIEIQGYRDQKLPPRMFQYFYRILDRYKMPVTTLVILTDSNPAYNPSQFRYDFLDTKLEFQYRTYKILDQSREVLEKSDNPFATVILTALLAIRMRRESDPEKLEIRTTLVRQLIQKGFPKTKIRSLLNFIRFYTQSGAEKMNQLFEDRVLDITQNNEIMGLEELIIQQVEEQGIEKGIEKGIELGIEKGTILIKTRAVERMLRSGASIEFICEILEVSPEFISNIQASRDSSTGV